jgi:hypothetical protein
MGQICCHKTPVYNYHTTPRNMPEERRRRLNPFLQKGKNLQCSDPLWSLLELTDPGISKPLQLNFGLCYTNRYRQCEHLEGKAHLSNILKVHS